MLKSEWTFAKKVGTSFLGSLFLEVVQFIFVIGSTDITDLLEIFTVFMSLGLGSLLILNM